MSKKDEVLKNEEAERKFTESVKRFADAFFALTDEEKEELQAYVEVRCQEAEEEYKKHVEVRCQKAEEEYKKRVEVRCQEAEEEHKKRVEKK